jgi:hypothetical protein
MYLTYHAHDVGSGSRDRPDAERLVAGEIEVTPEMIEAGIDEFYTFHWDECSEIDAEEIREAMRAAFVAMWRARS